MEEKKIKVLLVNGSPRPNHNTGKALKAAMEGAIEAGAEAELINLYSIKNLKGCTVVSVAKEKDSQRWILFVASRMRRGLI